MEKCRSAMQQAADCGARLVVFPELSLTGFTTNASLAEPPDGDTVSFFSRLTGDLGVAAAFGFACHTETGITNRLCIADKGFITAKYDKIHPFSYGGECAVYSGGNSLTTIRVGDITAGLSICYDLRFPEIYQAMSGECRLLIVAANWPDSRAYHWDTLLKARAIENQCFVAGCNRCGSGDGLHYSGGSIICSPTGEVISSAEPYTEQLIFAEIDSEEVGRVRSVFPLKKDRRQDLYIDFYAK